MKDNNTFITKGYIKKANDFFRIAAINFTVFKKQVMNFFRKEKNTIPALAENTTTVQKEKKVFNLKSKKIQIMSNLRNSVQLIGRLGKTPEFKQLESGKMVANVSIATNDIYKNSKGEKVIETQWHNLVAWGKNAENFQKILGKGDEVAIQGKLTHRSYEDKEGNTRYVTEVVVNEFVKLSNRNQLANVA